MKGAVLYAPRDVRFEEREPPKILAADGRRSSASRRAASAARTCGRTAASTRSTQPTPMGHEYCGIVEEVGRAGHLGQAGAVRHRLVLRLRQHVPALQGRLPDVVPAQGARRRCAGAHAPRAAGRRHPGRHARGPARRADPEHARRVRRLRHRMVRRRRGQREAGHDRRGRRRRRGRAPRRALGKADGRRADPGHEQPRAPAEARPRVRRDRHRQRARRGGRRAHQGADEAESEPTPCWSASVPRSR